MKTQTEARLLRIFIGETDKISHVPVYEKIVTAGKAVQIVNDLVNLEVYDKVIEHISGRVPVQVRQFTLPIEDADMAQKWIEQHGITR